MVMRRAALICVSSVIMSVYSDRNFGTSLKIALHDKDNGTYRGSILLQNWTAWYGPDNNYDDTTDLESTSNSTRSDLLDPLGASYYVIAVILVYGMSIVALIASHIKRKKAKLVEDKQINKYLREFQTVQEESSRETYKNLKKRIKEQINWDKQTKSQNTLHHNLSQALLPMLALGVSLPRQHRTSSLSSNSFQGSRSSLGAIHSRAGSMGQINVGQPRSRTNSVGSNHNVSITLSSPTSETVPAKHERKRGLANLFPASNNDCPLEKILEESLDSRASSFKRKNSKKSLQSTVDSLVSSHDTTNDLNTLSDDLYDSHNGRHVSDIHRNHTVHDHLQTQPHVAGSSKMLHLTIPSSHADAIEETDYSDCDVGAVSTSPLDQPVFTLAIPTPQFDSMEQIWVPCSGEISASSSSYNNNSFTQSPSLGKSRGSSPRSFREDYRDVMLEQSSDNSDSDTEQLLHITCV